MKFTGVVTGVMDLDETLLLKKGESMAKHAFIKASDILPKLM
jgi:hypothetical protein